MLPEKLKENEKGTIGLPIRIVVLSIIGLVGFYAILSALGSTPASPEPMYATANISSFSVPTLESGETEETSLNLLIKVLNRDNQGVGGANIILRSPDRQRAYSGVTNSSGNTVVKILNPELPPGKAEGYVSVKVMRARYMDFTNDYFVKIIRS